MYYQGGFESPRGEYHGGSTVEQLLAELNMGISKALVPVSGETLLKPLTLRDQMPDIPWAEPLSEYYSHRNYFEGLASAAIEVNGPQNSFVRLESPRIFPFALKFLGPLVVRVLRTHPELPERNVLDIYGLEDEDRLLEPGMEVAVGGRVMSEDYTDKILKPTPIQSSADYKVLVIGQTRDESQR